MIMNGMEIVHRMAYQFSLDNSNSYEDYRQEGYVALLKAIRKSKAENVGTLGPYIRKWVRGYMLNFRKSGKKCRDAEKQFKFEHERH